MVSVSQKTRQIFSWMRQEIFLSSEMRLYVIWHLETNDSEENPPSVFRVEKYAPTFSLGSIRNSSLSPPVILQKCLAVFDKNWYKDDILNIFP
jgi:hypothetical protein